MKGTICEGIDEEIRKQKHTHMTRITDINELRLRTFLHDYETHVAFGENGITTLFKSLELAVDWIGGVSNWTMKKFTYTMMEPESAWAFFYKYEHLHTGLSAYLALVNFIRSHTSSFGDDDYDNLDHVLRAYKGWEMHGMVSLMVALRADGLDIVDIEFDEFVKLNEKLQNPY